jgi:ferredoxin
MAFPVFQDSSAKKKKKFPFKYAKPNNIIRYSILALTLLAFVLGSSFLVLLLDPYSTFGRITSQLFKPLVIWTNNGLASALGSMGNYSLYKVEQNSFVPLTFGLALLFLFIVILFSWNKGRLYCNTICPIGSGLGLLSKFSLFKIKIDESSCTHCGICSSQCKSQCIDIKNMKVDDSRCVTCFNCISSCKNGSIKYEFRYKQSDKPIKNTENNGRRTFLMITGAIVATAVFSKPKKIISGNNSMLSRKPIMPPGATNIDHFNSHCTACQLCVTKCPMQVLKPAALQYGISGISQPHLVFSTEVFCSYNCNICTTVCPTTALKKLDIEEKKITQLGIAQFTKNRCIVFTDETDCGACSEHCPTQAVHMIPYKNGLTIPEVTEEICIGCGACESICPAKPYKAIYVEGTFTQLKAKKPAKTKIFDKKIDNFGF